MNNKLRDLVKKVIIGATAALSTNPLFASSKSHDFQVPYHKQSELTILNLNKESKAPTLILQKPSILNTVASLFHSSHSSHASHSSHSSHYSSYSDPAPTTTSTPESTPVPPRVSIPAPKVDVNKNEEVKVIIPTNNTSSTLMVYKLGSRKLEKDSVGTDVAELQDLLIHKGYKIKITAVFDNATKKALMSFQKKKKIDMSGKLDVLTLYYLQKK